MKKTSNRKKYSLDDILKMTTDGSIFALGSSGINNSIIEPSTKKKDVRRAGDELVLPPIKQLKQKVRRYIPTSTEINIPEIKDKNVAQGTQDFVDWYTHPESLSRFSKNTGLTKERLGDLVNYGVNVPAIPSSKAYPLLGEDSQAEFQGYDVAPKEQIIYNKNIDKSVIGHERGHAAGIDTVLGPALKRVLGDPFKQTSKNAPKVVKRYMDIPEESYGNFHQFRVKLGLKPGEQIKNVEDLESRVKSSGADLENFYQTYDNDKIIKAINTIASTNNDVESSDIQTAALGTGQKGTQMKRKKYALGTTGIENPATTIAKNNIMIAQAEQEAESNPWIPITMMAGQLASSAISAGAGGSGGGITPQVSAANELSPTGLTPVQGATFGQNQFMKAMGDSNASGEVEVEGKEVIELPTGQVGEVKGDSHENGGVPMDLPEGTKIYSKRIEKFGNTMAERKKIREKKKLNLDELLATGKTDVAIRNAHKRTMEILEAEEAEDLKTQEMFGMMAAIQEFAYGTNKDGTRKYALGSPGITADAEIDLPGTVASRFVDKAGTVLDESGMTIPGVGDMTSIFGDLVSTFGPMKNTLANRATDTPNINPYKDFGKDALETNLAAMEMAGSQKASAARRITDQSNTAKRIGRNTARGVNQARALDLATDINTNEANQSATDSFTRTMQELLGSRAGLENQQDQMVMQGEASRDLADRQDKDNFYTQKGRDISTQGQGIQQIGKDLNASKKNELMTNVINQLSKYGLAFDAQGNLIQKPQTT